jgi:hypothetical protein
VSDAVPFGWPPVEKVPAVVVQDVVPVDDHVTLTVPPDVIVDGETLIFAVGVVGSLLPPPQSAAQ